MASPSSTDAELERRLRQQEVVADVGQRAVETDDVDALLETATRAVAETLGATYVDVLELLPRGDAFLLRHGHGWGSADVEGTAFPVDADSLASRTLESTEPVVESNVDEGDAFVASDGVDGDVLADEVFEGERALDRDDVESAIGVVVGSPDDPRGVLLVEATDRREFDEHDATFLAGVANALASAMATERARSELDEVYGRITDAFFALDDDWRFTYLNERAHELINPDGRTLVGKNVWEEFPDAAEREFKTQYERAMTEQETVAFEEYSPEPLDAWFEVRAYPSDSGLSVYFRDVTERKAAEERLAEERDIFAQGPAVVFRWEAAPGWPVSYVSENVEDVLGYTPAELESGDVLYTDLLLDEEIDRIAREVESNSDESTERFSHEPYRVKTKDGDVRWVKDTTKIRRDEDGEITHYLGYLVDITERKERERELRRYETIVEAVNDGVYVVDEDGRFAMVNDAYAELVGYDREELLGEHVSLIVDDEIHDRAEAVGRSLQDGDGDLPVVEAELERKDGERVPTETSVALLPGSDEDAHRVGVVRDVSEWKARELELERYETLFVESSDVNAVLDPDGTFTFLPPSVENVLGYEGAELVGENAFEHVHPADRDAVIEEFGRMAADPDYRPVHEFRYRHADGSWVWLEARGRNLLDDPNIQGLVAYTRDVTERVEREQDLQRTERRFEAIFEDSNILVGLLEPDGTVLDINQTAMEYIDADLADVVDERFWETPWWGEGDDVRADVKEWVERAAAGEYVDFEADLTRPDGTHYTLDGFFRPVTNEDGDVVSIVVSDRDVTERREYERQLAESERRYRALVEHFPNGAVALVDRDLNYQTVGGRPEDVADVTAEEIEGRSVYDAIPSSLADELVPCYEAALEGASSSFEAEMDDRIYQFQVVPVRDDEGEVFAALGMSQDITERKHAQRRLAESERRYRGLAENFPNGGVGVFDEDLRYTVVTGTMWEDIEPDAADLEGKTIWEALPPDTAADVEPVFRGALDGETDSVVSHLSGRTYRVWATPLRDADGEIMGGQSFAVDITEQLEREEQLAESERRYRALAEYFPNGIVTLFDQDLEYELAAGQAFEDLPLDPGDVEGNHFGDVWDDDTVAALEPAFEAALDGEERSVEVAYEGREWLVRVVPITDERGDVFAGMTMAQDVTERIERERALEESKNQLQALIELLPVGVFVAEAAGEIVEWNEAAEEIWGGEVAEPNSVAEYAEYDGWWLDSGEPVEPDEWALARALRGEEVTDPDVVKIRGFDGEERTVLNHGMPVRDADGEVSRAVVTLIDITERREYERKLEVSNERLEQFAYAASHDLQEPLRMVSSYLQLIERRYGAELDEEGREFLEFAVDGAERMRDMINGLLEYSRVDTRGDSFEPVDLDDILADVREDLQVRIEESDAEITAESLPQVQGDEGQLRQLFQNLLDNAIEYSGDEPPRIDVTAERVGNEWAISVHDEGVGIDSEDAERVFEVFQRLHGIDDHAGTGIGLALCERIVERHGGDIWVESTRGHGATFTFTLPVEDAREE